RRFVSSARNSTSSRRHPKTFFTCFQQVVRIRSACEKQAPNLRKRAHGSYHLSLRNLLFGDSGEPPPAPAVRVRAVPAERRGSACPGRRRRAYGGSALSHPARRIVAPVEHSLLE